MAVPVIMPKFEMSQETATLIQWLVEEGQAVEKGQPLLEVETDKVTMEIEAPASGILAHINASPGAEVPVTEIIAYVLEPGEALEAPSVAEREVGPRATPVARRLAADLDVDLATVAGSGPAGRITKADVVASAGPSTLAEAVPRPRATPAARRIAREMGIDLAAVAGSGPRDRIQAADVVLAAPEAAEQPEAAPADGMLVPLTGMRATIARRMTESYRQAPHIHLTRSVDVGEAEAARQHWSERYGERISLTVLLVKACAWALRRHPAVNATIDQEGVRRWHQVNVAVAVALPDGLIVPVIKQADVRPLTELARELTQLTEQAKQGTLRPDQVSGGTFTLTNLGMFGVEAFDPILNPPQVAILGVAAVIPTVVPLDGDITIRPRMQLTLAADHRALDGAVAALFLQDVSEAIEHPSTLLL